MLSNQLNKKITGVDFGLFSPEEIKRGSVVHIVHPESVENGIPKDGGLIDLRMGSTEKNFLCLTCGENMFDCVGHYGHIELCKPMFHVGYVTKIKKLMDCICFYCSKIKDVQALRRKYNKNNNDNGDNNINSNINSGDINGDNNINSGDSGVASLSLEEAWAVLKTKTICCSENDKGEKTGCNNKQPTIKKEGLNLVAFMKGSDEEGKVILNGEKVHNIFRKIDDRELSLLGFNVYSRPENMLMTVLLVAPPCMRPSILTDGLRAEDDLTHKYADIVKSNSCLKKYEQEGAPGHIIRDYEQLLQFHLATIINNEISGQPMATQKSGRPIKSIAARLKGKEGRVRGNLMGKRVDFSARSVITPDASIDLDEVGVPLVVAMIHTFPEKVNSININSLQKMVNNGPNEYPGANYVIRNDGQRIDLKYNRFDLRLEKGFVVERHMVSGDTVLFNRQPSLHKMSMMGHRVRVMDNKTFRLNLSVTSPYNADFDGDEMNLHMPQSYNSKSELQNLAAVCRNIISPQSNKPVMGIVQDTLVGVRLFTLKKTFFNKRETMNLLFTVEVSGEKIAQIISNPAFDSNTAQYWTGLQIFSTIFPESLTYYNSGLKIRNSEFLRGTLSKGACGAVHGGLVHVIYNDYGHAEAVKFINNIQRLINHFMFHISSFTIGVGDTIVDTEMIRECEINVSSAVKKVDGLIHAATIGQLEKLPGLDITDTFESHVNVVLNKARDYKGEISQCNNMNAMILSGSKGSKINIAQMTSCVGQQNVEGKRIPFGFEKRSLPHFQKFNYSAGSRGFISNSYLSGMTPAEFFFHAMGGREGLIDTAIKTAETGYIQRRLVKAMEDAVIREDTSVRNGFGKIYQFTYGEDGFDAKSLERVILPPPTKREFLIDMFVEKEYMISKNEVSREIYEMLRNDLDLQKKMDQEFEYLVTGYKMIDRSVYVTPVNIQRLLNSYASKTVRSEKYLSPWAVYEKIDELMNENEMWNYYVKYSLNVRKMILTMDRTNFFSIVEEIKHKYQHAKICANETVGTLAAQSVGEPATQMTLNTFHLAGVASTVTMGVPRLNEIINTARTIKTPAMTLELEDTSIEAARELRNSIEYSRIKDIFSSVSLVYDSDVRATEIQEDKEMVEAYFEMPDEIEYSQCSPFVLRFELDRYQIVSKGLSVDFVVEKISSTLRREDIRLHIISSEYPKMVIRIRTLSDDSMELNEYTEIIQKILRIPVQGLEGIKRAHLTKKDETQTEERWSLQTDGVSFREVLSFPNVNGTLTTCNDLFVVYETLGVEALRETIMRELTLVIETNGSYVNSRHLGLLADVMTVCGYPAGITRHGVNMAVKAGALKRASFEETVDILMEAASSAEKNPAYGISENIMMGQIAPLGTGNVNLILDTEMLDRIMRSYFTKQASTNIVLNSPAYSDGAILDSESIALSEDSVGMFSPQHENPETFTAPEYLPGMTPASAAYSSPGSSLGYSPASGNPSAVYAPNSSYFYQAGSNYYAPASGTAVSGYFHAGSGSYQAGSGQRYDVNASVGSGQYSIGSGDYDQYSMGSGGYNAQSAGYNAMSEGYTLKSEKYTKEEEKYPPEEQK